MNSQFINNKATVYTNNLFLSFSDVNVTDCKFSDNSFTNATNESFLT